jgi:hypothetical protein
VLPRLAGFPSGRHAYPNEFSIGDILLPANVSFAIGSKHKGRAEGAQQSETGANNVLAM